MYRNKNLKRSYVFAYVMWVFGIVLFPFLFIKNGGTAGVIITEVLAAICLGAMIVSQVFYVKNRKIFFFSGTAGLGLYTALTLMGLLTEIIFAAGGESAVPYYWVMIVLTLIAAALCDLFFALDIHKSRHPEEEEQEEKK